MTFHSEQVYETRGVIVPLSSLVPERWMNSTEFHDYELAEWHIVTQRLRPDDIVMEIGTGMGFISTVCAKTVGSDKVYTFEANKLLEPVIRKVFQLNGVEPELNFCLLSHEEGQAEFYVAENFLYSSSTTPTNMTSDKVVVPKRLFNAEILRIKPTFLIVDIEGGEHDLFMSADLEPVQKILVEIHGSVMGTEKRRAIFDHFRTLGFAEDRRLAREVCSLKRRLYLGFMDLVGEGAAQALVKLLGFKARVGIDETHFFYRASGTPAQ